MPTCSHCGAFCRNDAQYCSSCGAHFATPKETAERSEQAFNDYFSRLDDKNRTEEAEVNRDTARKVQAKTTQAKASNESKSSSTASQQVNAAAATAAQYMHTAAEQVFGNQVSYRDALKRGWADLRAMPNWIVKLLLLSLINCIPILNFFVGGFVLRWGARAAFGDERTDMNIFQEGSFLLGFFQWIISIIWGIVLFIVGVIPIVGLVAVIFALPVMQLCYMRLGMSRQFGDAFEFDKIWAAYKDNLGSLVALYWLPSLISAAVLFVSAFVVFIVVNIFIVAAASMPLFVIFFLFGMALLFIFAFIAFIFIIGVQLVVARAYGHWIAGSLPEWVDEAHALGGDALD